MSAEDPVASIDDAMHEEDVPHMAEMPDSTDFHQEVDMEFGTDDNPADTMMDVL